MGRVHRAILTFLSAAAAAAILPACGRGAPADKLPINPPMANAQTVGTAEDTPLAITLTGSDPDGTPITYSIASGPGNGALSGTPPSITYTPNLNYNGSDSFTFTVSDGSFTSASATVSITVTPVNDAPVANNQAVTTGENTPLAVTLTGSDLDGDPITYSITSGPGNGALSGTPPSVTYTPNLNYNGADSFTFTVSDGSLSTTGYVWVLVSAYPTGVGITRVSVDSSGAQGCCDSFLPSMSADGRYVAFHSFAALVPEDTNAKWDSYVHDRLTGTTTRVSVDSSGMQGNESSWDSTISLDGRYVAFYSKASNLVPGDAGGWGDVFVHDRVTASTTRVSVDSAGAQGNNSSHTPSLSADGRFVAFMSWAPLVTGDTNGVQDIFVHDRNTGTTTRVSVDSAGAEGNGKSVAPSISLDGRYVAFYSDASNLVLGSTNGRTHVFVHDRATGMTSLVSVDSAGTQGNGNSFTDSSFGPSMTADGRYVAFDSYASNLVVGDTNGVPDVFVHDRLTGTTTRVSVDSGGIEGNDQSKSASISADGRYVAFYSRASNLVTGDTNFWDDVFVHDRQTGTTTRVSVDLTGVQGNETSALPSLSADGRYVAFQSGASNLVSGDTNGAPDVFVAPGP